MSMARHTSAPPQSKSTPSEAQANLDPADWTAFRRQAHRLLDDVISHIENIRQQPVWQPAPPGVRQCFAAGLPEDPCDLAEILERVKADVIPYATGNLHPLFMGWVHGSGTPVGVLAEMLAAGLNMNCGGRDHIGIEIERQIVRWMAEAFSYPQNASGIFVTGSSMANYLAVITAKCRALGNATRKLGLCGQQRTLVAYASVAAHGCIARAMELSGIGSNQLRLIPTDPSSGMDGTVLENAIRHDIAANRQPFLIVGTAGSVDTGSFDCLSRLAEIASAHDLWFHIDGAIGALSIFAPDLRDRLGGAEKSDSIALDFHKWGHVPYDAGFLLVRDEHAHKEAFSSSVPYLQRDQRGAATGDTWPCDLGPDLSRGTRALKTWMTLKAFGSKRMGDAISQNCAQARYLAKQIQASPLFELKAAVHLNIVCFGLRGSAANELNREVLLDLQEQGQAVLSWTRIGSETVMRCAIVNHRTTFQDIDNVMSQLTAAATSRMCPFNSEIKFR